jgi:hypothetical protein
MDHLLSIFKISFIKDLQSRRKADEEIQVEGD